MSPDVPSQGVRLLVLRMGTMLHDKAQGTPAVTEAEAQRGPVLLDRLGGALKEPSPGEGSVRGACALQGGARHQLCRGTVSEGTRACGLWEGGTDTPAPSLQEEAWPGPQDTLRVAPLVLTLGNGSDLGETGPRQT